MKSDAIIEKIRKKLDESNPESRTVLNVFQFNFTDSEGNNIKHVVFDFKKLEIYEGTTDVADAEISVSDEDFFLIGTRQLSFDELLSQKKANVKGDMDAISKMLEKFRVTTKN